MRVLVTDAIDDEAPTDDEEYSEWIQARVAASTLLGGRVYAIGDCAANEENAAATHQQVASSKQTSATRP